MTKLLHNMQDILDSESPISLHESGESECDSDVEALPATENLNFNLAEKEFGGLLEEFKLSRYWPIFVKQEGNTPSISTFPDNSGDISNVIIRWVHEELGLINCALNYA
jgi:hypothetical protein